MPRTGTWRSGNPFLMVLPAPIDISDPSAHVVVDAATTIDGHCLDRFAQTELAVAALSPTNVLNVESTANFVNNQIIELTQGNNSRFRSNITVTSDTVITLDDLTTANAGVGARVIRSIGPVVAGAAYGTPSLTSRDWGYTIKFPATHGALFIDELQQLLFEAVIDKVATGAHWEQGWDVLRVPARARV